MYLPTSVAIPRCLTRWISTNWFICDFLFTQADVTLSTNFACDQFFQTLIIMNICFILYKISGENVVILKLLVAFRIFPISRFSVARIRLNSVQTSCTIFSTSTLWTLKSGFKNTIRIFSRVNNKSFRTPIAPAFVTVVITVIAIGIKEISITSTGKVFCNPSIINECVYATIKCFWKVKISFVYSFNDDSSFMTRFLKSDFNLISFIHDILPFV